MRFTKVSESFLQNTLQIVEDIKQTFAATIAKLLFGMSTPSVR